MTNYVFLLFVVVVNFIFVAVLWKHPVHTYSLCLLNSFCLLRKVANTLLGNAIVYCKKFLQWVAPPTRLLQCCCFTSQEWNDELAGVAQAYSEKCTTQPNPDRASQAPSFSTVGENLGGTFPLPSSVVEDMWLVGRRFYSYSTQQCNNINFRFCDQYIQVGSNYVY